MWVLSGGLFSVWVLSEWLFIGWVLSEKLFIRREVFESCVLFGVMLEG